MSSRRDCVTVIDAIMKLVPSDLVEFRKQLEWNRTDASYKAPEETLQWQGLSRTLSSNIPYPPTQEWHHSVLSAFMDVPIEQVRLDYPLAATAVQ